MSIVLLDEIAFSFSCQISLYQIDSRKLISVCKGVWCLHLFDHEDKITKKQKERDKN